MEKQKKRITDLALSCKAILSFDNLTENFSDIDAVSTTENDKVVIEEKFRWFDYYKDTYFVRQSEIDFDRRPAIVLCSRNSKDIKNETNKIVELSKSVVVMSYDNTKGDFSEWFEKTYPEIKKLSNLYGSSINTFLFIWKQYIKERK